MKLRKFSQVLLAAASFASASAFAGQVTYNSTLASALTDQDQSLSFQQFDSSLGTLDSITLSFNTNISSTVDVIALAGNTVKVSLLAELFLTHPDNVNPLHYQSAQLFDQLELSGTTSATGSAAFGASGLTISASDFAMFTHAGPGTGYVYAPLYVMTTSSWEGDDGQVNFTTYAAGSASVTYNFTTAPVPEPETYGMMLLGLGAIGVVAKRKSRSAQA
ncbi:PEP-CTERM protein-sorting domain-containing protein [Duganella sp. CF402]|uniref:choice-of-anchor E domain-containing protein n=1 Tax=unclassified Duganella TaxID=2636909 RepID=UPI0008CAAC94|nr:MULTISPECIES: choice-of-anchor E domain-containing protein [unclassified Duganella]RZT09374.1 putative secreted protein with PEP-CTERM sorting signal [Duganella sp. BK701]SEL59780.1 PEP-CTERM protein-sorting domain-containing protein [Duganella sp. CF402]